MEQDGRAEMGYESDSICGLNPCSISCVNVNLS